MRTLKAQRKRRTRRKATRKQKGGDFLAGGADTLVWDQKPTVKEKADGLPAWLGLPIEVTYYGVRIPVGFETIGTYGEGKDGAVVRMILLRDGEMEMHRALKRWSDWTGKKKNESGDNRFVKMHLNTFIGGTGVYYTKPSAVLGKGLVFAAIEGDDAGRAKAKDEALKDTRVEPALDHKYFEGDDGSKKRKVEEANDDAKGQFWYGLITRRQTSDIKDLDTDDAILNLVKLTQPLLRTDGLWIHHDLHTGNMGIMPDGTPVMHDYGRMKFRDYDLKEMNASRATFPSNYNMNVLRNVLPLVADEPVYFKGFHQYYYAADLVVGIINGLNESCFNGAAASDDLKIKNRRKLNRKDADGIATAKALAKVGLLYAETPVHVASVVVSTEKPMEPGTFDADLSAAADKNAYLGTLYKDPVYETRYHHLARIWDLLAVLRAVSFRAQNAIQQAYTDEVKAAAGSLPAPNPNIALPGTPRAKYEEVRALALGAARILDRSVRAPHPTATRDKVKNIVNGFCSGIAKQLRGSFKIMTDDKQDELAKAYWDNVNDARTGAKAPAAAPGGGKRVTGGDPTAEELKAAAAAAEEEIKREGAVAAEEERKNPGNKVEVQKPDASPKREEDKSKELCAAIAAAFKVKITSIDPRPTPKKPYPNPAEDPPTAAVPPPRAAVPPPPPLKAGRLTRRRRLPRRR